MRITAYLSLVGLIACCAAAGSHLNGGGEKEKMLVRIVMDGLAQFHYSPEDINDQFSERVYKLYVDRLDHYKRFLTQDDIVKLSPYRKKIDDQIKDASFEFFDLAESTYAKRLAEAEGYFEEILSKPMTFTQDEHYESDPEKLDFAKNEKDLKDRWRLLLKFSVLDRLLAEQKKQEKKAKEDPNFKLKTMEELEAEARNKVLESNRKMVKRLKKDEHKDQVELYLNCITSAFDPHTNYYAPIDKKQFDTDMSGKLEGIGAQLRVVDEIVEVTNIVPGSPSAKQGELKEKDKILKVAQGEKDPVDVIGMDIDDVVQLIRGAKGTEVRLTVRKPDGSEKVISIIRDIVIMEESFAKSSIIEDKNTGLKVGLIHLPRFYADFKDKGGRFCSTDVKNELLKLKEAGVNGVVMDLRFNGGGSLNDVVDMAGYFIEEGPIVQVKNRGAAPYVMYDRDRKVIYDGPLAILVNSSSASASEILAAAMQDYKRAVIIGGTSTFGKGTVQRFIDLDDALSGHEDVKPLGSVKLTIQKFFRIDGGATQLKGVTPDIVLPDAYNYLEVGEREEDFPMVWNEVEPAKYQASNSLGDLDALISQSKARVEKSEAFKKIEKQALWFKAQKSATKYPLKMEKYKKHEEEIDAKSKDFENIYTPIEQLSVYQLEVDKAEMAEDSAQLKRIDSWHKNLQKDPYVLEACNVINDLTKVNGKSTMKKKG